MSVLPKIAYIVSAKKGMNRYIHNEIVALRKRNIEIDVYHPRKREGAYNLKDSVRVTSASNILSTLGNLWRLRRKFSLLSLALRNGILRDYLMALLMANDMRKRGIGHIPGAGHIHSHMGGHKLNIAYFCSKLLGIDMTTTVHAYELYLEKNKEFFRETLDACVKVVTICEHNKMMLMDRHNIPEDRIEVVPIFVELQSDSNVHSGSEEPSGMENEPSSNLLFVGFCVEKKGMDILFRAFGKLLDGSLDVKLQVVTDDVRCCRAIAGDCGVTGKALGQNISFFSDVSEDALGVLYEKCDVLVLPSRTAGNGEMEGTPAVIIEAMLHGKPVISTKHAGIPEIIDEYLVEENNVDELCGAIEHVLSHKDEARESGKRNREKALAEFSEKNVEKLIEVFRTVTRRQKGALK